MKDTPEQKKRIVAQRLRQKLLIGNRYASDEELLEKCRGTILLTGIEMGMAFEEFGKAMSTSGRRIAKRIFRR